MLKRLLLCLALLTDLASAQVDISNAQIGQIRTLARNAKWNASGLGGINNSYLFTPSFTNEAICLYVSNNDQVNVHPFQVNFFSTGDETVSTFQGNFAAWQNIGPISPALSQPLAGNTSVSQGQTRGFFALVQNAARVAILFSAGTGGSTVSLTLVESQNASGCGNVPSGPVTCPISASVTVPASTTSQVLAATNLLTSPNLLAAPYVCSISLSFPSAPAAGSVSIIEGTGTNCGTSTLTEWSIDTAATTPLVLSFASSSSALVNRFDSVGHDLTGNALCLANNQASVAVVANLTLAQF